MLNPKQQNILDSLVLLAPRFDALFAMERLADPAKGACATYSRILAEVLQDFGWKGAAVRPVYVETGNRVVIDYLRGKITAPQARAKSGVVQIWGDVSAGSSYMHAVCYNPSWKAVIDLSMTRRGSGLVPSRPYWAEVGKWPWWIIKFEFKNYPLTYRAYEIYPWKVKEAKAMVRATLERWK